MSDLSPMLDYDARPVTAQSVLVGPASAPGRYALRDFLSVHQRLGSQLGLVASGAGSVILIVGAQKIVPDVEDGVRRIYDYCLPLENKRACAAYGVGSAVNNVLVLNGVVAPNRVRVINELVGL